MTKRVCYIHIGPHKTGTSSIQWFLKQNRGELLKHGYFVPESGANHGAHHALARKLCGQELQSHQQSAAANFARALDETPSEAVVISSEALEGLLRNQDYASAFFTRIRRTEPRTEARLVAYATSRNGLTRAIPQWLRPSAAANHSKLSFKEPLAALFLDTRP